MFEKHIYTVSSGDYRERNDGTNYYVIWEVANDRTIDPDNYRPYLDYTGAVTVVNVTPPVVEPDLNPTYEERISAIEQAFIEDLLSRL